MTRWKMFHATQNQLKKISKIINGSKIDTDQYHPRNEKIIKNKIFFEADNFVFIWKPFHF